MHVVASSSCAIRAIICSADDWVEVELFGKAKLAWLRTFLELPNGIPSHDTSGRVLARLNAERFQACFVAWILAVSEDTGGQVIATDGKVLRGSCPHPASAGDSCRDRQPAADRVQVVKGMHGLLGALKAQGLLTDEEFAAQKAKLLGM
ncbi:MAG: ISAs1 family transposase [Caldilinea sp.]